MLNLSCCDPHIASAEDSHTCSHLPHHCRHGQLHGLNRSRPYATREEPPACSRAPFDSAL
jgi:hypothetical protein